MYFNHPRFCESIFILCCWLATSDAAVTTYTDETDFNTAIASMVSNFENFDGFAGDETVKGESLPFTNFTIDDEFVGFDVVITNDYDTSSGTNSIGIRDNPYPGSLFNENEAIEEDSLFFTFPSAINAFGIKVIAREGTLDNDSDRSLTDDDIELDIELPGPEQNGVIELDVSTQIGGDLADGGKVFFWGIVDSTSPFTKVQIDGNLTSNTVNIGYFYNLDDVTTATAVPEPGGFFLVLFVAIGTAGCGWLRRQWKKLSAA